MLSPPLPRKLRQISLSFTVHHLRIFEMLYRFGRLDFPTLAYLVRDLPWSKDYLRAQIRALQHANCVHVFYGSLGQQPIFALLDRGLNLFLEDRKEPPRRMTAPRHSDAERIRKHDAGLSRYLVARDLFVRAQGGVSVCHRDIFFQSLDDRVRSGHRLPVSFAYGGRLHHYHLKPDAVTGYSTPACTSFSITEFDASSESCAPMSFRLRPANLHAKFVVYVAAIETGVVDRLLGLDDYDIEFVFLSDQRRDNALALAASVIPKRHGTRFVFATQPPCPIAHEDAFSRMKWVSAAGEKVQRI